MMETKNNKDVLMTTAFYEKNQNTKTTYNLVKTETEELTMDNHRMGTSDGCMQFFKRLGSTFTRKFRYTNQGYKCVEVISVSPDKQDKFVCKYKFL
jgi:hypothetical protein